MVIDVLRNRDFTTELIFSASRSSGAGGQNVNKVNTKVEMRFHIDSSSLLSDYEKTLLHIKLVNKITSDGFIIIVSQTERSQLKNKEIAIEKFNQLLRIALTPRKKRKPTHPTHASKEKRLSVKRVLSEKKSLRKKYDI